MLQKVFNTTLGNNKLYMKPRSCDFIFNPSKKVGLIEVTDAEDFMYIVETQYQGWWTAIDPSQTDQFETLLAACENLVAGEVFRQIDEIEKLEEALPSMSNNIE